MKKKSDLAHQMKQLQEELEETQRKLDNKKVEKLQANIRAGDQITQAIDLLRESLCNQASNLWTVRKRIQKAKLGNTRHLEHLTKKAIQGEDQAPE